MRVFYALCLIAYSLTLSAHQNHNGLEQNGQATATYLGNEAVMVKNGSTKIVFDPFFHNNFNIYQLVPKDILAAMFDNNAPYDNIDAIFISHAHGDHFAADQVLKYLKQFPKTKLIAPKQAIDQIKLLEGHESILPQTTAIDMAYGDPVQNFEIDKLEVGVVRIPHSGWPTRRLDVSNLVFRVTLDKNTTVMHMGDADPNDVHFKPHDAHWQAQVTDTAFPPYWFFYSTFGPDILDKRINAIEAIGVHVPMKAPEQLKQTGKPYFSQPGEIKIIQSSKQKTTVKTP
ncbi:MBL fold metallo-hydrolase [Marinicella rhabdoformis]|uniref:MBL fold metallo-hydrolase n=1 Tax=Marinicella rhabdoformis TaxID=2580566 RepID=UPI0012AED884|nr:MBL fold metallo-hydrolase [Marinicella rhabdoformis]